MEIRVGIGLVGCGTVGSSVAKQLLHAREAIEARAGVRFELRRIAVRSMRAQREASIPRLLLTDDPGAVADDPSVDLLVECAGGSLDAADIVERALCRSAHVVTANKDLIATQGPRLSALAAAHHVSLSYEAAACGAIPIVRVLKDALAGDEVIALSGVVNGTTTAILSAMEQGAQYEGALAEAQRLGYAEADPSNDVDGVDAAHKLALLMQLAFGEPVLSAQIARGGIGEVTLRDVARARMLGYRLRLIAAARRSGRELEAQVGPVLIPEDHPFAQTRGPQNVIRLTARGAGELTFSGPGAGGVATASAVLGDIVSALRLIAERGQRRSAQTRLAGRAFARIGRYFDCFASHPELPDYPVWCDGDGIEARSGRPSGSRSAVLRVGSVAP